MQRVAEFVEQRAGIVKRQECRLAIAAARETHHVDNDRAFLATELALAAIGGVVGLLLGIGLAQIIQFFVPALPVHTPLSFVLLAETLAAAIGLAAGVLPARRAALLDPVEALRTE